jgi:sporulation protein YlmC with PRC-barrel domain
MKTILPVIAVSFLSTICPISASAEDAQHAAEAIKLSVAAQKANKEANEAMQQMSRASKIIGVAVVSPKGDSLGSIDDLIIDPVTSQVVYAVVSYGEVMGMGGKLFGMPWKAMLWNQEQHHYVVNVDQDILAKSPGFSFDADKWPTKLSEFGQMGQRLMNP